MLGYMVYYREGLVNIDGSRVILIGFVVKIYFNFIGPVMQVWA